MLANRLKRNLRKQRAWVQREEIRAWRVYDSDLPDYSAAIDLFEERWVHIQEYEPPPDIDPQKAARRLEEILAVVPRVLGVKPEDVFLKHRHRQRGREALRPAVHGGAGAAGAGGPPTASCSTSPTTWTRGSSWTTGPPAA